MKRGRNLPENPDEFSKEELAFIEYLATPESQRGTQADLAKEIDVAPKTLSQWKKRTDIKEAVHKRALELSKFNGLPRVIKVIEDKAAEGNLKWVQEYRLWYKEIIAPGDFPENGGGNNLQVNINSNIPRSEKVVDIGGDNN